MQILAGGLKVLEAAGCSLVGGHTTEGTELTFGLSVNGQVHPERLLRKGPLHARCALILTKALGTGTILAAHMRGSARAEWVQAALESMTQSNKTAARILQQYGSVACTDVTGFGFLGHLLEMQRFGYSSSSDETACAIEVPNSIDEPGEKIVLRMNSLPVLPGAVECVKQGVLSSLQSQNIRSAQAIGNVDVLDLHPAFHLLFDPQTSGGLLACVPLEHSEAALAELRAAGYAHSAVVGWTHDTKTFNDVCHYTTYSRKFSVWLKAD